MAPIVHGLEAEYWGKIQFAYLDIDNPQTDGFKEALGYRYQPEYYLLDGTGNVVEKWVGFVPEEEFVTAFDALLSDLP